MCWMRASTPSHPPVRLHTVNEGCEPISYTLSSRTVFSGDNHRSSDLAARHQPV